MPLSDEPWVFLSVAGEDRPQAKELDNELRAYGLRTFLDEASIDPGCNLVTVINKALDESDYFVLLWSAQCAGNAWVELEYGTALYRELDELDAHLRDRRAFLFVVRLDDTPLPRLLSTRKYLDSALGWPAVANALMDTWRRDRATKMPVVPATGRPIPGSRWYRPD